MAKCNDAMNESNDTTVHNSSDDSFDDANETFVPEMDDTIASQVDDRDADPDFVTRATVTSGDRPFTRSLAQMLNPFAFCAVSEALNGLEKESWKLAIEKEMRSLMENHTWDLVPLPNGQKALKNKWVLRRKTDTNGNIERYKARLVVKGCSQREGIDYDEVYSPVVRYASIRYLISLAVQYDMDIFQLDAITAFLQGDLNEDVIYLQQPEHFGDNTNRVCRLRKSIYGLENMEYKI